MKYHALFAIFENQQKLQLSSAANDRLRHIAFIGSVKLLESPNGQHLSCIIFNNLLYNSYSPVPLGQF